MSRRPRYVADCGCTLSQAGLDRYLQLHQEILGNPIARNAGLSCPWCHRRTHLNYERLPTDHLGEAIRMITESRQRQTLATLEAELINAQTFLSSSFGRTISQLRGESRVVHSSTNPNQPSLPPSGDHLSAQHNKQPETSTKEKKSEAGNTRSDGAITEKNATSTQNLGQAESNCENQANPQQSGSSNDQNTQPDPVLSSRGESPEHREAETQTQGEMVASPEDHENRSVFNASFFTNTSKYSAKGCGCKVIGCSDRRCGCRKRGLKCGPNCRCYGCCNE